jgi:hypothetical protein
MNHWIDRLSEYDEEEEDAAAAIAEIRAETAREQSEEKKQIDKAHEDESNLKFLKRAMRGSFHPSEYLQTATPRHRRLNDLVNLMTSTEETSQQKMTLGRLVPSGQFVDAVLRLDYCDLRWMIFKSAPSKGVEQRTVSLYDVIVVVHFDRIGKFYKRLLESKFSSSSSSSGSNIIAPDGDLFPITAHGALSIIPCARGLNKISEHTWQQYKQAACYAVKKYGLKGYQRTLKVELNDETGGIRLMDEVSGGIAHFSGFPSVAQLCKNFLAKDLENYN